jgi:hypothetical protein
MQSLTIRPQSINLDDAPGTIFQAICLDSGPYTRLTISLCLDSGTWATAELEVICSNVEDFSCDPIVLDQSITGPGTPVISAPGTYHYNIPDCAYVALRLKVPEGAAGIATASAYLIDFSSGSVAILPDQCVPFFLTDGTFEPILLVNFTMPFFLTTGVESAIPIVPCP